MRKNYFLLCMLFISSIAFGQMPVLNPGGDILIPHKINDKSIEKIGPSEIDRKAFSRRRAQGNILFSDDFNAKTTEENNHYPVGWDGYNFDGLFVDGTMVGYPEYIIESKWTQLAFGNDPDNRFFVGFSDFCDEDGNALPGTADDWLISPVISLPDNTEGTKLIFNTHVFSLEYPDGLEVWVINESVYSSISKTSAQFVVSSSRIYQSSAEHGEWTTREVELDNFMGNEVRIMFRNNNHDKSAIIIDDVVVIEGTPMMGDPCPSVSNLQSKVEYNNEVVLTWDAPTAGTPTEYSIYQNGFKIGTTQETTYRATVLFSGTHVFSVAANYENCNPAKVNTSSIEIQTCAGVLDFTVEYTNDCTVELSWDISMSIANELLWDNTNIYAYNKGLISTHWANSNEEMVLADDFVADSKWTITSVLVAGFNNKGTVPSFLAVNIYKDDNGKPGEEIFADKQVSYIERENNMIGTLNTPFTLPDTGKYWIGIMGVFDTNTPTSEDEISIYRISMYIGSLKIESNVMWKDFAGFYGGGDWQEGHTLSSGNYSMYFSLKGDSQAPLFYKYNVYRDGEIIASDIEETSYIDTEFDSEIGHEWAVTVVCPEGGESGWERVTKGNCPGSDINNPLSQSLTVFPNPASAMVSITDDDIQKIDIYNAVGQLVESVKNTTTIDVSSYSSGVYFFQVSDSNNNVTTRRIIVVR